MLDPELDLRTVRYKYWKSGGDMKLYFRFLDAKSRAKDEEEKEEGGRGKREEGKEEGGKKGKERLDSVAKGNTG